MVTRIPHEKNRFYVDSDTSGSPYVVDLEDFSGNGSCTCDGFSRHFAEPLEAGMQAKPPEKLKCKHIIRAFIFVAQTNILNERLASRQKESR